MIIACLVFGSIGIVLFITIISLFTKLLKKNESGFLHLLMSLMFVCYLPIPITVNYLMPSYEWLLIGTIFGVLSLMLFIITMIFQASHLSYSARLYHEDEKLWGINDKWMMDGLLGSQIELLAGLLKGIWIVFLTICFWKSRQVAFFILGLIYSFTTIVYFFMLIDTSLVKDIALFKKLKLNFIIINLEVFSWFLILLIWIVMYH